MTVGESAFWSLRQATDAALSECERNLGTVQPGALQHEVRLERVSFSYADKQVLSDVSMNIPAGQLTALVGTSGAGKTTIADLIIGLHRPEGGEIYVDGVAMGQLDIVAWRQTVGYVPQETFQFHDSIFQNVALGDPSISRDDVEAALNKAGAWEFVSQLPEGIDTVIGEAGAKLSGGQRQRVAIARALVRKPTLLVLDEVTTALDPSTEAAVSTTLKGLRGSVTILAISHQPALVERADTVYRVEGQRVWKVRGTQPEVLSARHLGSGSEL
jgi:ATP-binding cassette subfamily C protein